jgi:asparagine synthase (glutamine-hydrolysing)
MSVLFGNWSFDGQSASVCYLQKVCETLAPFSPHGLTTYRSGSLTIVYGALHTTKEARSESQPLTTLSDAVITWDGRLDNRVDLGNRLGVQEATDVQMVGAAYERWGPDCFEKFIGDWAVAICNPQDCSLFLAKDFVGTRHLFYHCSTDRIVWSTLLDPLVLLASDRLSLDKEYLAGWLTSFPATDLTPYTGIHSVRPSSYLHVQRGKQAVREYWGPNPRNSIDYRRDQEYEEHFRCLFEQSVRRRLRSDRPVLAELSGGMDSSAIVCMADRIMARGQSEAPRLDTLSYYDDTEPNWNERPYFSMVEEKRGRTGCHIDASGLAKLPSDFCNDPFVASPGSPFVTRDANTAKRSLITKEVPEDFLAGPVRLSGLGGDEVLGGVPTHVPEIADLVTTGQFLRLSHQLVAWSLVKRKPLLSLAAEVVEQFLPRFCVGRDEIWRSVTWIQRDFAKLQGRVLRNLEDRLRLFGPFPSFQENLRTLGLLRRQLACTYPCSDPLQELRYPYLDRDLLEFLYAIPREQLVRPHQRRSLVRRALAGIVPDQILNRKRKAFVIRGPLSALSMNASVLTHLTNNMLGASLGIINPAAFAEALLKGRRGQEIPVIGVFRTLTLEYWLRHLAERHLIPLPKLPMPDDSLQATLRSRAEVGT